MTTPWLSNMEILMEERRADLRREVEQLQLEREAESAKPRKLNWFARGMTVLSILLISIGKRINRRYNPPAPLPRWYQSFDIAR